MKERKEAKKDIEKSQKSLYLNKFKQFGENSKSLSWNDKSSQFLRFEKLSELFQFEKIDSPFSVHEIGCGLAHFIEYLKTTDFNYNYSGSDIVSEFIEYNRKEHPKYKFFIQNIYENFDKINENIKNYDYYIISGTFYTKENNSIKAWEDFIYKSTENMFRMAKKGIAFNFLTSYSDFFDEKLYYADPKVILDKIIKNYSRFVNISQIIPLYEFTVVIYKESFLQSIFPSYQKYFKISAKEFIMEGLNK